MSSFKGIPINSTGDLGRVESGAKYRNEVGIAAVKDGIKKRPDAARLQGGKPRWLKAQVPSGQAFAEVRRNVREHRLISQRHCVDGMRCCACAHSKLTNSYRAAKH